MSAASVSEITTESEQYSCTIKLANGSVKQPYMRVEFNRFETFLRNKLSGRKDIAILLGGDTPPMEGPYVRIKAKYNQESVSLDAEVSTNDKNVAQDIITYLTEYQSKGRVS